MDVDTSQASDLEEFGRRVKSTLEGYYSEARELLLSDPYREVERISVYFDPNYNGVAYASGLRIVGAVKYYRDNQHDIGSMVHEMAHVIQNYRKCEGWITEGIADWVRYFHFEPERQPSRPVRGQHYSNGYGVAAYFLDWLNTNYQPAGRNMTYHLNKECRDGTYQNDVFVRLTGKTADDLWQEMKDSPVEFTVVVDTTHASDLAEFGDRVKEHFFEWYPKIRDAVYSPAFEPVDRIRVYFDPNQKRGPGGSSAQSKVIYANIDHFRANRNDLGSMVGLMNNIILQYGRAPSWILTGMYKWIEKYHYKPETRPGKPRRGSSYQDGWDSAAYFFDWLNQRYQPNGEKMTYWLNDACRKGEYSDDNFTRLTGKTVQQNWDDMMRG